MFPEAKSMANALLRMRGPRMSLMEYYLYPPKHISPAVLAALTPPPDRKLAEREWHEASGPELSGQKRPLNYAKAVREEQQAKTTYVSPAA